MTIRDHTPSSAATFMVSRAVFDFGAVLLPRPTSVALDRARLAFRWGGWDRKHQYKPPANLLAQFLSIKTAKQTVSFAARYGPLHSLGQKNAEGRQDEWERERIRDWRHWIVIAHTIVKSGENLVYGRDGGSLENWRDLHAWVCRPLPAHQAVGSPPAREEPEMWRLLIAAALGRWFDVFGGVGMLVDWRHKSPRLEIQPPSSLGVYLGHVMLKWIGGAPDLKFRRCGYCGDEFKHRTNAVYCLTCRKNGIPALLRKQKQRAAAASSHAVLPAQ